MGAEQDAGNQVGKDDRQAEAPESCHQQDGGEQQDQQVGVQISLSFYRLKLSQPIWRAGKIYWACQLQGGDSSQVLQVEDHGKYVVT